MRVSPLPLVTWVVILIAPQNYGTQNTSIKTPHFAEVLADFAYQHGLYYHQLGCPMHYPANRKNPSIIDLVFLPRNDEESIISIGKRSESDHGPFFVELRFSILTGNKLPNIKAGLEADAKFTSDIIDSLNVITEHMQSSPESQSCDNITHITKLIGKCFAKAWKAHATPSRTSGHSKGWWDKSCAEAWSRYRESDCSSDEWRNMQCTMKAAKCKYFNNKIESIADHNKRPWDLMSWTCTQKLDSSEAIIFKGEPCLTTKDHWNAFQKTFNSAHKRDTYSTHLMRAIHPKPKWAWAPFCWIVIVIKHFWNDLYHCYIYAKHWKTRFYI